MRLGIERINIRRAENRHHIIARRILPWALSGSMDKTIRLAYKA